MKEVALLSLPPVGARHTVDGVRRGRFYSYGDSSGI